MGRSKSDAKITMKKIWAYLKKDKKTALALGFLFSISLAGLLLPFLSIDPNNFDPLNIQGPQPPSWQHPFGTDDLGRDLLLRCIDGARVSLMVGLIAMSIAMSVGTFIGAIAAYIGGWVDQLLMRILELFLAIPSIFLILTIQIMLKPSIYNVMIIIGLTSWMGVARLVRAELLSIKERTFITAARARNIAPLRLLFKHMLPHAINPMIVAAMLGMGYAILLESVLSFLGLGVQPPNASWGNMLENSLAFMRDAPWMALIPGLLITATVMALNYLGDALRQAWDPRA
ncbi:MAG: ABC transporter permease [bacterium]